MVNISQMVDESLARHGVEPALDHERLEWSRWFRCDSSFSVLLAPAKPGLFALAEEMPLADGKEGKRMLALFQVAEADDLGMTLGRLFLPGSLVREKLEGGRCFARFTVIEDREQRSNACGAFQRWMREAAETASGLEQPDEHEERQLSAKQAPSETQPSLAFPWGDGVDREMKNAVNRPASLPSGF